MANANSKLSEKMAINISYSLWNFFLILFLKSLSLYTYIIITIYS